MLISNKKGKAKTPKKIKKKKQNCTKIPPPNEHHIVNTFCKKRFLHFWCHFENGPDEARNTIKIGVSEKFGERSRGVFGADGVKGESGPRCRRIWSPFFLAFFGKAMLDRILSFKTLRSAAGSVFLKKKGQNGTKSSSYSMHLCVYIHIYIHISYTYLSYLSIYLSIYLSTYVYML